MKKMYIFTTRVQFIHVVPVAIETKVMIDSIDTTLRLYSAQYAVNDIQPKNELFGIPTSPMHVNTADFDPQSSGTRIREVCALTAVISWTAVIHSRATIGSLFCTKD